MDTTPPRLVATDLDGTIVRSDGTVSARTAAAFARIEPAGSTFVLVTGRPPRWLGSVVDVLGHRGLAICANGALVYDLHTERVVRKHLIAPEAIAEAVERLRAAVPGLTFAVEREDGFFYEASHNPWVSAAIGHEVDDAALVSGPGSKLLAVHSEHGPDTLMERAEIVVGGLVTVTHSSGRGMIEMSAYGVSKASALAELCADRDVHPADVAAFGDMPNDLPMLCWAGRSYAVANAHPDVLAVVDHKVPGNDDDGVAQTLERMFP